MSRRRPLFLDRRRPAAALVPALAATALLLAWPGPAGLPAAEPGPPPSASVAALKARFAQGRELLDAGKPAEALKIFASILQADPNARGSLAYAGYANLLLGRPAAAIPYLERFRALEPRHVQGLVWSIQACQSAGRAADAEQLAARLAALRNANPPPPELAGKLLYPRQKTVRPDGGELVFSEYFDCRQPPYTLYDAELSDGKGQLVRRMTIGYDDAASRQAVANGKAKPGTEIFYLNEFVMSGGAVSERRVYREMLQRPSFIEARSMLMAALASPQTPLFVEKLRSPQSSPAAPAPEIPDLPKDLREKKPKR